MMTAIPKTTLTDVTTPQTTNLNRPEKLMDDLDHQVLRLEAEYWRSEGAKIAVIRGRLGLSYMEYLLRLTHLLDDEVALAAYPLLINRLLRARERRRALHASLSTGARPGGTGIEPGRATAYCPVTRLRGRRAAPTAT